MSKTDSVLERGSNHHKAKFSVLDVRLMRRRRVGGWTIGRLASEYKVNEATISKIVRGLVYKEVPFEVDPLPTHYKAVIPPQNRVRA